MACDYAAIRAANELEYGRGIGRFGPTLLTDRYDDRTHFILELLQNAEDALSRRSNWAGSRSVVFRLTPTELRVSHYGQPFDEDDVRGICGIAESTKGLNEIGRFGIGFKSVYAFTDRPEIHSGKEDFAIENLVWPFPVPPIQRNPDETVILIPLKRRDGASHAEIVSGLTRLGPSTLLFLRQIEEIHWSVAGGQSGHYLRESTQLDSAARRVTVIGQQHGEDAIDQDWLVFSRPLTTGEGHHAGHVEIAFRLVGRGFEPERIVHVDESPLVVFFPTVLETHLGFLVQGPYRTTPSRDNVPRTDPWNQHLVSDTASLLLDALRWLRDQGLIDVALLRCLPLDAKRFGDQSMFSPLFHAVKTALLSDALLPRFGGGYTQAPQALLGRSQDLRDMFESSQLSMLFGAGQERAWLSAEITQDRAPDVRRYLMQELKIPEVTPELMVSRLDRQFLEAQSDEWIRKLYEYLNGQPSLRHRLESLPLVRLETGTHVPAQVGGVRRAFLPGPMATDFPTVRAAVCATEEACAFLRSLGLTEPDPVDDVIRHILPKYEQENVGIADEEYAADMARLLGAFDTDSKLRREELVAVLRRTPFVISIDAGERSRRFSRPTEVYLATDRLKRLFAGVGGVLLVDDGCSCLRGERVRELLEACGVSRYLQPIPADEHLSGEELRAVRRGAGLERSTWARPPDDTTLRGLKELLKALPDLEPGERKERAAILWEALCDVESRRGSRAFLAEYTWGYSHETKTATFDAAFVRTLNSSPWVPDEDRNLQIPERVLFESLGWQSNPSLQSRIRFKPPAIEALAREAGIEPGVLELLKKYGVTSVAELEARLGLSADGEGRLGDTRDDDTNAGPERKRVAAVGERIGEDRGNASATGSAADPSAKKGTGERQQQSRHGGRDGSGSQKRAGARSFVSYVAVHADDEVPDPDGLDKERRVALEESAIRLVLRREPQLQRTPAGNPGFDLFERNDSGEPVRWIEVKAMTGALSDRPVGLSCTQFEYARDRGEAYWLYVVEHAGNHEKARVVRICNPAGRARTYTFDEGWMNVAEIDE